MRNYSTLYKIIIASYKNVDIMVILETIPL